MRALGQNPVNAEVLKVLGNPKSEGEGTRLNVLGVTYSSDKRESSLTQGLPYLFLLFCRDEHQNARLRAVPAHVPGHC